MYFNIPDTVKLGNTEVLILYCTYDDLEKLTGNKDAEGCYCSEEKVIYLEETLSDTSAREVFFHEIGHAIEDIILSNNFHFTDTEINFLGVAISQVSEAFTNVNGKTKED